MRDQRRIARAATISLRRRTGLCPDVRPPQGPRGCCLPVKDPPKRPDPGLYSQQDQLAGGLAVTWDSPDITTNLGGDVDEHVMVTVRNYSADSPAIATDVELAVSEFGIGFARQSLGSHRVNLTRAGSAGDERQVPFFVPASVRRAFTRVAAFVTVIHPHDRNHRNNAGEQAWSASTGQAGQNLVFGFRLRNSRPSSTTFALQLIHSDLAGTLNPATVNLNPGEVGNITLSVAMPASATGSHRFNVAAFTPDGALYGGIFHRFDVGGP